MTSEVPYLPIDNFENQNLEEFIRGLEITNKAWSEDSREGQTNEYSSASEGYSQYVELVLQGMGMQKYASLFEEEDISLVVLASMKDDDLIELGITSTEDRKYIVEYLEQFRVKNGDSNDDDLNFFDVIDHDLTIASNISEHIAKLNSYLSEVESKIRKKRPEDYLICDFETGLKYLEFTLKHAIIQTNRMSELLFGKQFDGRNVITSALNVIGSPLPHFMREKLMRCRRKKKLRKCRLIATVLMGIGIGVTIAVIKKRMMT